MVQPKLIHQHRSATEQCLIWPWQNFTAMSCQENWRVEDWPHCWNKIDTTALILQRSNKAQSDDRTWCLVSRGCHLNPRISLKMMTWGIVIHFCVGIKDLLGKQVHGLLQHGLLVWLLDPGIDEKAPNCAALHHEIHAINLYKQMHRSASALKCSICKRRVTCTQPMMPGMASSMRGVRILNDATPLVT